MNATGVEHVLALQRGFAVVCFLSPVNATGVEHMLSMVKNGAMLSLSSPVNATGVEHLVFAPVAPATTP